MGVFGGRGSPNNPNATVRATDVSNSACIEPSDPPSRRLLKMPSPKAQTKNPPLLVAGSAAYQRLGRCRALHAMNLWVTEDPAHILRYSGASTKLAAHHALFPFNASVNHPPNIPKPPRGVIAPSQRILVTARRYKEPLKRTKPTNMSQNARRGNGSHREITKRTTACTR
jgi:hypothetical protein